MWITFALISLVSLGFYDIFKKLALDGNNMFAVLFVNTLLCTLFMSPVIVSGIADGTYGFQQPQDHLYIIVKSLIVTTSWLLGYSAMKHLPLTIAGSINALRPIMVLVGAIIIYSERPGAMQWTGIIMGFGSLLFIGFIGSREGLTKKNSRWIIYGLASMLLWAVSGLYDKFLLRRFTPLSVEAWYSFYQFVIMLMVLAVTTRFHLSDDKFKWNWSILLISIFITAADLSFFYALKSPGSMVSIVSMIRRGSAVVTFIYGVLFLHERNVRLKFVDMGILVVGMTLIILGSL